VGGAVNEAGMDEWNEGGCHCGAVRFRVKGNINRATLCNCSICTMKGFLHLIVPADHFQLIRGADALTLYQFNTKTARHYFCATCGIAAYYIPRSHPDGVDVNLRCLDDVDRSAITVTAFNGADWEANIHRIEGYEQ
jgi:hypothetical protein